ncbi:MAG: hypothetical protein F6J98_08030 [Moorea sp. SIO4G2]|uniref:hypothetical protein n=1 Tax=unclassified Moorena TaxID=2683338 RepID=UPI0013CC4966|nr:MULTISPECIES: hypothetical protein [unclassified Moorena]NEO60374.1 hypothetical protein [Moorena sp. SIO4G2]NEO17269.1 hypothetical protein [Moorena sp. SIO3E8]NEO24877.1 hypothetical protein [Moorena sp. SIO4A5]NEO76771.1 hypothetical protein [Moorena sp. SIO4G3]NEQ03823.1 hypothetical protein [Moorena sp. SIO3F7]
MRYAHATPTANALLVVLKAFGHAFGKADASRTRTANALQMVLLEVLKAFGHATRTGYGSQRQSLCHGTPNSF